MVSRVLITSLATLVTLSVLCGTMALSEDGVQAPTGVSAALGVGHVLVTWSAPSTGSVDDYMIYRNSTSTHGTGLNGTYYDTRDFTGAPHTRIDSSIDFQWGAGEPLPGIDRDTFSVRWTGHIRAPSQGRYAFYALSDDGVRLSIDGTVVCADWTDHAASECSGSIELAPGLHPLLLEFYESGGDAVCVLYWQPPSMQRAKVPSQVLFDSLTEEFEPFGTSTKLSFKDGSVVLGVDYRYYIVARSGGVSSAPSETVSITYAERPAPPKDVSCSRGTDHVNLTWGQPEGSGGLPILGYKVYRGSERGEEGLLETIGSNATLRYTDSSIDNRTTYYYYVTSFTAALESGPSPVVKAVAPGGGSGGQGAGLSELLSPTNLLCLGSLVALLVILSATLVSRRRKWQRLLELHDRELPASNRPRFLRAMNRAILVTTLSMVLLLCVLGFAFMFSMAFVYTIIGIYMWLAFILVVGFILVKAFLHVRELNGLPVLDAERFSQFYGFVEDVSRRFGYRPPSLKVEANEEPAAFTTSFLGGKTVIVLSSELLDMHSAGVLDDDEMRAVLGHEMGHIVNHDATAMTILWPFIEFVRYVKEGLEWVIRIIIQLIFVTIRFGLTSLLNLLIALMLIGLFILMMLLVGIFYVIFYALFLALDLCNINYERQVEYGADLFGGLALGSPEHISTALMELNRYQGICTLRVGAAKDIVATEYRSGTISWWKSKSKSYLREVYHRPTVQSLIEQAPDMAALWKLVDMTDAKWLLEKVDLKKIGPDLVPAYSQHRYCMKERLNALAMAHPLMAYRVKAVTDALQRQEGAAPRPDGVPA